MDFRFGVFNSPAAHNVYVVIGTLCVFLRLDGVRSLKEKRSIIRPLLERVRHDFRASAAEVDDQDLWGNSVLGIAYVANDPGLAESVLDKILDLIEASPELEVTGAEKIVERR